MPLLLIHCKWHIYFHLPLYIHSFPWHNILTLLTYISSNCRWHVYSSLMAYLLTLCIDGILLNHHLLSCSFAIYYHCHCHFVYILHLFGITDFTVQMAYSLIIDGISTHTLKYGILIHY